MEGPTDVGGEGDGPGPAPIALTTDVAVHQRWARWLLSAWATSDIVIGPASVAIVARGWVGTRCFPRLEVARSAIALVRCGDDDLPGEVRLEGPAGTTLVPEVRAVRVRNAHAARLAFEACGYPLELGPSWEHSPPPPR